MDYESLQSAMAERVGDEVTLPPGYFIEYGGQFENQERAMRRLYVVVPVTLGLILFMLFSTYGSLRYAALIFLNIPFAVIGGIGALFLSRAALAYRKRDVLPWSVVALVWAAYPGSVVVVVWAVVAGPWRLGYPAWITMPTGIVLALVGGLLAAEGMAGTGREGGSP